MPGHTKQVNARERKILKGKADKSKLFSLGDLISVYKLLICSSVLDELNIIIFDKLPV